MGLVHGLQTLVALGALGLIAARGRALLFEASLDVRVFLEALGAALAAGHLELARSIAGECLPAWPARVARAGLQRDRSPVERAAELEDLHIELRGQAGRGLDALVTLGRLSAPLALIGVILELGQAAQPGGGILGLQRGLELNLALRHSLLHLALGLATALICFSSVRVLRSAARIALADVERAFNAVGPLARPE